MSDVRRRVVVTGRVQGVFFRDTCQRVASGLGVQGWVRNRGDGAVELVAEGPADRVAQLVDWCREGPPRAHVAGIDVSDEPPAGERGFRVRY